MRDQFQRTRLLKQVGGTRDDFEADLRTHAPHRRSIELDDRLVVAADVQTLLARLLDELTAGDHVVLMSNGSFGGLPVLLEKALAARAAG